MKKETIMLIGSIVWPILTFLAAIFLYNLWFYTWDKIKHDPSYSPEFDQNKDLENILYWSFYMSFGFNRTIINQPLQQDKEIN